MEGGGRGCWQGRAPLCCRLQPPRFCVRGKPKLGDQFGDGLESAGRNTAGFPSAEKGPRARLCPGAWHGDAFIFVLRDIYCPRAAPGSTRPPPSAVPAQERGVPGPMALGGGPCCPCFGNLGRSRSKQSVISACRKVVGEGRAEAPRASHPGVPGPSRVGCEGSGSGGNGGCGRGVTAGDSAVLPRPLVHSTYGLHIKGPFSNSLVMPGSFGEERDPKRAPRPAHPPGEGAAPPGPVPSPRAPLSPGSSVHG